MKKETHRTSSRFAREGVIALLLCLATVGNRIYALPDTDPDAAGGVPSAPAVKREPTSLRFTQTVTPHIIYIGDRVTITLDIEGVFALFASGEPQSEPLREEAWVRTEDAFISSVRVASPQGSGSQDSRATLIIELIPWKTGTITFNEINLLDLLEVAPLIAPADRQAFTLRPTPIEVRSLTKTLGESELRPPVPPLLLPGTRYRIWLFTILGVLLFAALIITALNARVLISALKAHQRLSAKRKVSRETRRKLQALIDITSHRTAARAERRSGDGSAVGSEEFAREWQSLMRRYLSSRFDRPFSAVTSNALGEALSSVGVKSAPRVPNEEAVTAAPHRATPQGPEGAMTAAPFTRSSYTAKSATVKGRDLEARHGQALRFSTLSGENIVTAKGQERSQAHPEVAAEGGWAGNEATDGGRPARAERRSGDGCAARAERRSGDDCAALSGLFALTDRMRFARDSIDGTPPLTPDDARLIVRESCEIIDAFDRDAEAKAGTAWNRDAALASENIATARGRVSPLSGENIAEGTGSA